MFIASAIINCKIFCTSFIMDYSISCGLTLRAVAAIATRSPAFKQYLFDIIVSFV